MNYIIYSGSYSINSLGATKSLCTKMVTEIHKLGNDVTWIGRGHLQCDPKIKCHSMSKSKFGEFLIRLKNKILRTFFNYTPNDIAIEEFKHYDSIVARMIKNGGLPVDSHTVFLGLSGMSLLSFEEAKKKGAKTVLFSQWLHPVTHNSLLEHEYKKLNLKNKPIPEERTKRQLEEIDIVDKVWVHSNFAEQSFLDNQIPKEKIINSPLGVDFNYYAKALETKKNAGDDFNILFVGNINPEKGIHILLQSILSLNGTRKKINLIFNGVVAKYFQETFNEYKEKLLKKGITVSVEPGVPLKNYLRSSLFILPSIHDSFGLVVLEAMACGLPVIVSSQVGAKDCILDGENGQIFTESNSEELEQIISKLLENDQIVEKWGKKSLEIAENYDWNKTMEKLVSKISNSFTTIHHTQ